MTVLADSKTFLDVKLTAAKGQ